jgi:hypothetical protein
VQRIGVFLALFCWIGSLVSGFMGFVWFVLVPPVSYALFAYIMISTGSQRLEKIGMVDNEYSQKMIGPAITLVLQNTITNAVILFVAFGIRSLFA